MCEPPTSKFISLGYVVTHYVDPSDDPRVCWGDQDRQEFASLSGCLAETIPDFDHLYPESLLKSDQYEQFGWRYDRATDAAAFMRKLPASEYSYPGLFRRVEAARGFIRRLLEPAPRRFIAGAAIHEDFVHRIPPADSEEIHCANAILEIATFKDTSALGGQTFGYDVLCLEHGALGCSWYCGGHHEEVREKFGIIANQHGLIDTYEEARRCAEYIDAPETSSEPGIWLPIRLTRYPDENSRS